MGRVVWFALGAAAACAVIVLRGAWAVAGDIDEAVIW